MKDLSPKKRKNKMLRNLTKNRSLLLLAIGAFMTQSCENRDLNEGLEFRAREIHEKVDYHFDKIDVDGIEYLILEKDNNNPHEGFGFMAFRANVLMEKQDSIIAYLRTLTDVQNQILSTVSKKPLSDVESNTSALFIKYLGTEEKELLKLEEKVLNSEGAIINATN